jgi:pyrimidine-nucleoside phosphorylase
VGVPTSAVLTAMEEPLGRAVGNALEVREAVAALQNDPAIEPRFRSLCVTLAAHGLEAVGKARSHEDAVRAVEDLLRSGSAAAKFAEIVAAQGGPDRCAAILDALPQAPIRQEVRSDVGGVVAGIDAEAVGKLEMAMGAGRATRQDAIDPAVGLWLSRKTGATVAPGDTLATLHLRAGDAARADAFASALRAAYRIVPASEAPTPPSSLVLSTLP